MKKTEQALEQLWDPYTGQYYSRDFVTHRLIKEPSLATLMPLYAGILPPDRVKQLVRLLENQHVFGTNFPVPSVPLNSAWFDPDGYWQGPTWFNTNWLIIDGLRRMGYTDHAAALTQSTLDLARQHGFYEYFDPNSGNPAGAPDFSWTAALTIDLEES
jgi:glycogen debranching enzyme